MPTNPSITKQHLLKLILLCWTAQWPEQCRQLKIPPSGGGQNKVDTSGCYFFFFACAVGHVGSQFPDQGLNPGHSNESIES